MKRGTPRHPKIADLCEQLNVPLYSAVGLLELLWHFTAEFAPQGNIGRFSDQRIEAAMGWDKKRGRLIEILTTVGWIDSDPCHRLVVHSWYEHADDSVRQKLRKASVWFVGVREKTTGKTSSALPSLARANALPADQPLPPASDISITVEQMHADHPKKTDFVLIAPALVSALNGSTDVAKKLAEIKACHAAWCKTEDWKKENGRYAPKLASWLADRGFTKWPSTAKERPLEIRPYERKRSAPEKIN